MQSVTTSPGVERSETEKVRSSESRQRPRISRSPKSYGAIGTTFGLIAGAVLGGILGSVLPFSSGNQLVGSPTIVMALVGGLVFGSVGALIGSLIGLSDPNSPRVLEQGVGGEPVAAWLIPLASVVAVATIIVTIGSALLTVGDTHHFGKDQGYGQAIVLGLLILAIITSVATVVNRRPG